MATISLVNPIGANQQVTSFITQKTTDGELIRSGSEIYSHYRANAAVAKGEAVQFVAATATVPLSVTPMATAGDARLFVGVATKAAAAGAVVELCERGICEVLANAQTVAFGDLIVKPGTNAGEPTFGSTDPDAATVVGTVLGVCLAAKNATTLLAPCHLGVR